MLSGRLDALLSNVTPALRDVLREAYDVGYRDALAAGAGFRESSAQARGPEADRREPERPSQDDWPLETSAAATTATDGTGDAAAETGSIASPGVERTAVDWSGSVGSDGKEPALDSAAKKGPLLKILPHATVGTLLERILYHDGRTS